MSGISQSDTKEWERGQRLEQRFATIERIVSDNRKDYTAAFGAIDQIQSDMGSMREAMARIETKLEARDERCSDHRRAAEVLSASIKDAYVRVDRLKDDVAKAAAMTWPTMFKAMGIVVGIMATVGGVIFAFIQVIQAIKGVQ